MLSNIDTRTGVTLTFFALSNKASFLIFILNSRRLVSGWLESFQRLWGLYQGWFRIFFLMSSDSNSGWFGSFPGLWDSNWGCFQIRTRAGLGFCFPVRLSTSNTTRSNTARKSDWRDSVSQARNSDTENWRNRTTSKVKNKNSISFPKHSFETKRCNKANNAVAIWNMDTWNGIWTTQQRQMEYVLQHQNCVLYLFSALWLPLPCHLVKFL